jgi:hypothetical protein
MTPATTNPNVAVIPNPTVSPASFISELKNPATYLTLASYVPMFWALFFNGNPHGEGSAIAALHIAALLCGPIATAAYAIGHALKASAHESRLKEIESAVVSGSIALIHSGVTVDTIGEIEKIISGSLASVRGSVKVVAVGDKPS